MKNRGKGRDGWFVRHGARLRIIGKKRWGSEEVSQREGKENSEKKGTRHREQGKKAKKRGKGASSE